MVFKSVSDIKRAQKERLLLREIAQLFIQLAYDEPSLKDLVVNRVVLSPDKGTCFIYFYTALGRKAFEERFDDLVLFKPSLRKALAQRVKFRYVPQLVFKFDDQYEKQMRIENLLEEVKKEDNL